MFAPHPDADESLACGILLQNAVQAGASISVVYVTDGENNPWPQRCLSRRWRLNPADRHKWAKLRPPRGSAPLCVFSVWRPPMPDSWVGLIKDSRDFSFRIAPPLWLGYAT